MPPDPRPDAAPPPVHAPPRFPPLVAVAIGIASVSFSAILIRLAMGDAPTTRMAVTVSFYRLLFATAALAPLALLRSRGELRDLARHRRRDGLVLALVGVVLALHFALWISSLALTTVANSVVLVSLEALFVPIGAHFLLRERVPRGVAVAVGVAFAGTALIFADELRHGLDASRRALLGDGMAVVAGLAAAAYFLAGRRYRQRLGVLAYALVVYGSCTVALFALAVAVDAPLGGFPLSVWLLFAAMAVFPHLLGHTLMNWALRWVPAPVVTIAVVAEPVVSSLLAVPLFGEVPGGLAIPGAALTLGAVVVVMVREGRRARARPVARVPS